jgi:hypothetical protein
VAIVREKLFAEPSVKGESVTVAEIMVAVVRSHFPPRTWAVCPNVNWMLPWEADIYAVSKKGMKHEVEIKVTKADLKNDAKKWKWSPRNTIQPVAAFLDCFWYAVPAFMEAEGRAAAQARRAGLFVIERRADGFIEAREVMAAPRLRPLTRDVEKLRDRRNVVWRLCSLRYWNLAFGIHGLKS